MAAQNYRDRLVDATLDLCTRYGYEAATVDQIATAADLTPSDFACYFATKDAAVMSIVDDLLLASAVALRRVEVSASPEQALLIATTEVLTAIIDGRGATTLSRMLVMGQIVVANPSLKKQASAARKRVLTQALADRMGVGADNRRVRRAVTMWSAIAAGAYLGRRSMAAHYDPRQDDRLLERMIDELTGTFADVMGETPHRRTEPPRTES